LALCTLCHAADINIRTDEARILMGVNGDVQLSRSGPAQLMTNSSLSVNGKLNIVTTDGSFVDLYQEFLQLKGTLATLNDTVLTRTRSLQDQLDQLNRTSSATITSLQNSVVSLQTALGINVTTLQNSFSTLLANLTGAQNSINFLLSENVNNTNKLQSLFLPSSVYLSAPPTFGHIPLGSIVCCTQYRVNFTVFTPLVGNQITCNKADMSCIITGGGVYMFAVGLYFGAPSTGSSSADYTWHAEGVGDCSSAEVSQLAGTGSGLPSTTAACLMTIPPVPTKVYVLYNPSGSPLPDLLSELFSWAIALRVG